MSTPYDVVYHWIPGGKVGHWEALQAPSQDLLDAALERAELIQGHVAHRGMLSIGAPEGAPSEAEIAFAYERSQKALTAAFELVQNPSDWKAAIDAKVPVADVRRVGGRRLLEAAVIHFTGTVPEAAWSGDVLELRAIGYRMGPCGP